MWVPSPDSSSWPSGARLPSHRKLKDLQIDHNSTSTMNMCSHQPSPYLLWPALISSFLSNLTARLSPMWSTTTTLSPSLFTGWRSRSCSRGTWSWAHLESSLQMSPWCGCIRSWWSRSRNWDLRLGGPGDVCRTVHLFDLHAAVIWYQLLYV